MTVFGRAAKYAFCVIIAAVICLCCGLFSCSFGPNNSPSGNMSATVQERPEDTNSVVNIETESQMSHHELVSESSTGNTVEYTFSSGDGTDRFTFAVTYVSGTEGCFSLDGDTLTFSGIDKNKTEYALSGRFYGSVCVDASDEYKFILDMNDITVISYNNPPLQAESADRITVNCPEGTENFLIDMRDAADDDDEGVKAALYTECDTAVDGTGALYIVSENNNGIHSKDDLEISSLTLQVECEDNALKGNDSLTVESGDITLIARTGDGMKTSNSDVSKKGNQRGTISLQGGNILIYAACDGIDASYNVEVGSAGADGPDIQIFTDKYSPYSEEVTDFSDGVYYIRSTSTSYSYSVRYSGDGKSVWKNSSSYTAKSSSQPGSRTTYYYYEIEKPSGYSKMELFVYSGNMDQGQDETYAYKSDTMTMSSSYDTLAVSFSGNRMSVSWTNYSTSSRRSGVGQGGMSDGNTDKGDYSTKGIKADNVIMIASGSIFVSSYDDALHANGGAELENGETSKGDIEISGGSLALYTNDDGVHADGTLTVSGGECYIGSSYEGLEGDNVDISGGCVTVYSSDDGINGCATSGSAVTISGGDIYVLAGGDGLDSNSRSSYQGFVISGGRSVIISTGSADSALDNENGYTFEGGYVLAVCRNSNMSSESTNCRNFSSVGTKKTISLSEGAYLSVDGYVTMLVPTKISALVIFLGDGKADISSSSKTPDITFDSNGVCWSI